MKKIFNLIFVTSLTLLFCSHSFAQNWYDESEERIEQIRKGDFTLKVINNAGDTLSDSISILLLKHEFPWGTVIPVSGADDYLWGRAVAVRYFNYGVTGNVFKWPWLEPQQNVPDYSTVDEILDWVDKVGFGFRGHALLWGGDESWQMPSWSFALSPEELNNACETHIRRDVDYFKGRVNHYDVVNEPTPGHETWLAETVGDSINWNSFKWARESDPDAKLFVNDYNIIVWGSAPQYKATIDTMLHHGAPIDGIGAQGHMSGTIDWVDIKSKLDFMAELGLPIMITEFDMEVDAFGITEEQQAIAYAKMMRIAFSYPQISGFVFWGFSDNDVYKQGAGIYTENNIPKIAADTVYNLLKNVWTTKLKQPANADKEYNFRGFYGDYSILVDFDGEIRQFIIPATQANEDSVFMLNYTDGLPPTRNLLTTKISQNGNGVELKFDAALNPETFNKEEFHVYTEGLMSIDTIIKVSDDSTTYQIILEDTLKYRQFAYVFYNGESVLSGQGGKLNYFGPETIENGIPGFRMAETDTAGEKVIVTFSKAMNSSVPPEEFIINVDGVAVSLSSAYPDVSDNTKIILELTEPVTYTSSITVSYLKGTFTSTDGYLLFSFGPKYVQNNVPQPPVGINSLDIDMDFRVYPNPVTENLHFSGLQQVERIEIYDSNGKLLKNIGIEGEKELTINTQDLQGGILVCKAINLNRDIISVIKVIKK